MLKSNLIFNVNVKKALRQINKATKAVNELKSAMDKLKVIEIEIKLTEVKRKWWQFWLTKPKGCKPVRLLHKKNVQ